MKGRMSNYKIIAVTNQKGEVDKTTTTFNLSEAFSKIGKRILLVDCDPQRDLTDNKARIIMVDSNLQREKV